MRPVDPPGGDGAVLIRFEDLADRTERLSIADRHARACLHRRSVIDERLRIVSCKDCGEKLDPIEVLLDLARHWRRESWAAKRIEEHEAKERQRDLERRQRHVQRHMVCDGCGLESRLTVGRLTADDLAAWEAHFALGHVPETRETMTVHWSPDPVEWVTPAHTHRRRTPDDVARRDRGLHAAGEPPPPTGTTWVDRRPAPGARYRAMGRVEAHPADPDDAGETR